MGSGAVSYTSVSRTTTAIGQSWASGIRSSIGARIVMFGDDTAEVNEAFRHEEDGPVSKGPKVDVELGRVIPCKSQCGTSVSF